jgi:hypothetical protein
MIPDGTGRAGVREKVLRRFQTAWQGLQFAALFMKGESDMQNVKEEREQKLKGKCDATKNKASCEALAASREKRWSNPWPVYTAGEERMSNILRNQAKFITIPQMILSSGLLRYLSGSAVKLYWFLLDHCQHYSCVAVELSNFQIEDYTGLTNKSVQTARVELERFELISCSSCDKCVGNIVRYRLLNPEIKTGVITSRWLRMPNGEDHIRHYRRNDGRRARKVKAAKQAEREIVKQRSDEDFHPPSWDEIDASAEREAGE